MLRAQIIIIWALFFLFQKDISAQNRFNKAIDNPNYVNGLEFAYAVINLNDTSYLISSPSRRFPNEETSLLIIKTDFNGVITNVKEIYEVGKRYFTGNSGSMIKVNDTYVLAGSVNLTATNSNVLLVMFDMHFDTTRIITIDDSIYNIYYNLSKSSNGILAIGVEGIANSGNADLLVGYYDTTFTLLWQKRFGGNLMEEGYSIHEYVENKFIVFGRKNYNQLYGAPWVLRLDSLGNIIQQKWFNSGAFRCAGFGGQKSLSVNEFIITGCLDTTVNITDADYPRFFGNIDTNLNVTIKYIFNNSRLTDPYIVKQIEQDSSYIAVGYKVNAPGSNQTLGWICKIDKYGNNIWEREYYYKNELFNYFSDFQPTADGGFIITGATNGDTSQDVWLVKLDSLGLLNDSLIVNSGTVLANSSTNILQLYPNPAKEQLHLKIFFTQKQITTATLTVYDVLGKQIISENINLQQGKANHSINVSNLPSGNYIAIVQAGGEVVKQRFVRE